VYCFFGLSLLIMQRSCGLQVPPNCLCLPNYMVSPAREL
jgi:hypothetical protein